MKSLINILLLSITMAYSLNTFAADDNADLTQCRAHVSAEFEGADRLKTMHIKSRQKFFEAKFKVIEDGERAIVLCSIARSAGHSAQPVIVRIDESGSALLAQKGRKSPSAPVPLK